MNVDSEIRNDIIPNNILMIGTTGVGKTEIARRLAKITNSPFIKVEASKFTEVGYVGRDVESMIRDLMEQSISMIKLHKSRSVKKKASIIVENIILDLLIPSIGSDTINKEKVLSNKTRDYFREKIRNGDLDDKKIDINITKNNNTNLGGMNTGMIDESSIINLQDMINNVLPKKINKKKVSISDAKKILLEEESSKMIDFDTVKEEAIKSTENTGIVFIDEIDKIVSGYSNKEGKSNISREGVQKDLLPIVEGSSVNTKYGIINTDHILFIGSGAFHLSKPSDLIPELQGRFPIRVELNNLTKEDFYRILNEPKNSLIKQYKALFQSEGIIIKFNDESLKEIASISFKINNELENIGARRLHTVMSHVLGDFLFDIPDKAFPNNEILIDKNLITSSILKVSKNKDLSEYIL
jgi:ATP-dependent HslUV protease ATP-binding subunit HslU